MSFAEKFWIALVAIPGASLERAFWYFALAGGAWLLLHVLLAQWLNHRRINAIPTFRQMSWELAYSLRSLAICGLVGGFMVFAYCSGWTRIYSRFDTYGWPYF